MRWIEAAIPTESGKIDELCFRLTELGVEGLTIEDEADFRGFLENNRQYWDYVDEELDRRFAGLSQVKFYLPDDGAGRARLAELGSALKETVNVSYIEDSDWENNWREFYKPLKIGERLLVVPEWENPDAEGRTVLRLDPGLIFGTGSHATTRMCLCALQDHGLNGKRVLDIGCGSGILGIGAAVLGCESVAGCDVDPKAPDVASANAALNGIGPERFKVYAGDILGDEGIRAELGEGYETVLANIVADVIIPLSGFVRRFMAPDALFICSGIIDDRAAEVRAALAKNGFTIARERHEEEWRCFECV
ncbi:MAG: 50S ribosomal protein L11 methyltransferase [Butyricicoccus sp.]|nr:50S ribosomal protein L11 methyltransferase [Butyricicoccus sp.]